MQVLHEACLIEPSPLPRTGSANNKSLDHYCLQPQPSNLTNPVEHLACCSAAGGGGSLLAAHMAQSNQILIFDTKTRQKRDKFPLKALDKRYSRQSFQVSGMDFSQDGQRLAVGQTDCIIYIYKLAPQVSDTTPIVPNNNEHESASTATSIKTTISGKFASSSPISCLLWSELGILFGSQDGKVKLILTFNMPAKLPLVTSQNDPAAPATSGQQPSKVVTIFTPTKKSSMAISLAYRAPVLLIGQSNCSLQVLILSGGYPGRGPEQMAPSSMFSEDTNHFLETIDSSNLNSSPVSRRNSSSVSVSNMVVPTSQQQRVPTVLSSMVIGHTCPVAHVCLVQTSTGNSNATICCSGSDGRVAFHTLEANVQQLFGTSSLGGPASGSVGKLFSISHLQTIELKEDIMAIDFSHENECLAVTTKNRLLFISYDQEAAAWRLQPSAIELKNVLTLASVKWLRDGAQLAIGCSNNSLELFKCVWSKQSISDKLDICYIARNRIRIIDRERNSLATYKTQHNIERVNLLDGGQNLLVWTSQSLLLARLDRQSFQSEIKWQTSFEERQTGASPTKFLFIPQSSFVLIHHEPTGELQVLRLGSESALFSIKFPAGQPLKRDRISLRQFPPVPAAIVSPQKMGSLSSPFTGDLSTSSARAHSAAQRSVDSQRGFSGGNSQLKTNDLSSSVPKASEGHAASQDFLNLVGETPSQSLSERLERFAYVQDSQQTLVVTDLARTSPICTHKHPHAIQWIKFSHTSRFLALRDAARQLHLFEFEQSREGKSESSFDELDVDQEGTQADQMSKLVELVKQTLLLKECESHADWLPNSDSLVAQSGPIIQIWYDLRSLDKRNPTKRSERFDSRTFNYLRRPPLIDLSLIEMENGMDQQRDSHKKYPTLERASSADAPELELRLSNGQMVRLNRVKTRFYAKVAADPSLESAFHLLDGLQETSDEQESRLNRALHHKLGWLALESGDAEKCQLAWRIFVKLRAAGLTKYLERCLEAKGESQQECELMLAKLRGDWPNFERLARDQEQVVATYRRLNKWSLLVDYLERKQQFRQRDLAQCDQERWLVSLGRHREAGQLRVRSQGDLAGALELLLKFDQVEAAAELLLTEQKLPLSNESSLTPSERRLCQLASDQILTRLTDELGHRRRSALVWAGQVSASILADPERALSLYLEADEFEKALELTQDPNCKSEIEKQASSIHLRYADWLRAKFISGQISSKKALKAISHYLKSDFPGGLLAALEMANLLKATTRGHQILLEFAQQLGELKQVKSGGAQDCREIVLRECNKLAWLLMADSRQAGQQERVLLALELGEDFEELIEMLIELGQFERAFEVSLRHLNQQDRRRTEEQFIQLAREYCDAKKRPLVAEQIYLLVQRPELAIEMYDQLEQHDKRLELVEQHQPDQLEASLLQLARSLESVGRLEEAEKYLLRASSSEWTNVVRMYRLAQRWPDAYRVARANCLSDQDPLLVQLAYWWAKWLAAAEQAATSEQLQPSSSIQSARALLEDLRLLKQVVEFACEAKNFQLAMDLLSSGEERDRDESGTMRREVVLKFATFLEQQHKFDTAEQVLVDNDLCELAARMYLDNDLHQEAIRVIESQLAGPLASSDPERKRCLNELLSSTLVDCAHRLAGEVSAVNSKTPHLLIGRSLSRAPSRSPAPGQQRQTSEEKLHTAQQMLLRAQRPELAIEMYQKLGMWQEAIQVAQRFAPRLLESVEQALDARMSEEIEPILRATKSGGPSEVEGELGSPPARGHKTNGSVEGATAEATSGRDSQRKAAVAAANMELATWRQFEFSFRQDERKGARLHFDKFLSLLTSKFIGGGGGGDGDDDDGKQLASSFKSLRHLEKFLQDAKRLDAGKAASLLNSLVQQQGGKLVRLADAVAGSHFGWSGCQVAAQAAGSPSADAQARVWLCLRNILACCLRLCRTGSTSYEIQRRLLSAHYVTIYVTLVQYLSHLSSIDLSRAASIKQFEQVAARSRVDDERQSQWMRDLMDLLCKVSFSLVRFIDLLDAAQVLYVAGLWQMALGKWALARFLWTGLVELTEAKLKLPTGTTRARVPQSMRQQATLSSVLPEWARVDPAMVAQGDKSAGSQANMLSSSKLSQVRQWLLETLIEGGQSGADLAACDWPPGDWSRASDRLCLLSGLPLKLGTLDDSGAARNRQEKPLSSSILKLVRRQELAEVMDLCEIKSDKAPNINQLEELIATFEATTAAARAANSKARASSRPPRSRAAAASPRDQLREIVEFLLVDACELFGHSPSPNSSP